MQALLYLFAVKKNVENSTFSHLFLAPTLSDALLKFDSDLKVLMENADNDDNLSLIFDYLSNCDIYCLGSIDFVSGDLIASLENHGHLIELLEVLKNVNR